MDGYINLPGPAQLLLHTSQYSVAIPKARLSKLMEVASRNDQSYQLCFSPVLRRRIPRKGTRCSLPPFSCYIPSEAIHSSSCKTMGPWDYLECINTLPLRTPPILQLHRSFAPSRNWRDAAYESRGLKGFEVTSMSFPHFQFVYNHHQAG